MGNHRKGITCRPLGEYNGAVKNHDIVIPK